MSVWMRGAKVNPIQQNSLDGGETCVHPLMHTHMHTHKLKCRHTRQVTVTQMHATHRLCLGADLIRVTPISERW